MITDNVHGVQPVFTNDLRYRKIRLINIDHNMHTTIYQGEVEILQEDLGEFLNVAKKLKIEGLIEGNPPKEDIRHEAKESPVSVSQIKTEITIEEDSFSKITQPQDENIMSPEQDFNDILSSPQDSSSINN